MAAVWRVPTPEEQQEIEKSAHDQYVKTVVETLKTIGMITLGLLVAGALVQLIVHLITGYNPHFYGFVAYYIGISLGMSMVVWTNYEQEKRMYRMYAGLRYTVANGTCLSTRQEKAAFHYSLNTGVRYTKKYYAKIRLDSGTETEADVPLYIFNELTSGIELLCLHSDNANEDDEVNLVHIIKD